VPDLPSRPDLAQLRRQAKDLLRAAQRDDKDAVARLRAVSDRLILDSALLALAREYGFASWAKLKTEVDRREILDTRDMTRLNALLAEHPELAVTPMLHWCDHPQGATPLGYVAMLRYDTAAGSWRDVPGTGVIARKLLEAGAPPDGAPGDAETPLMTAASYGDAEVTRVLIEAGADLAITAAPDAGGVPGGTALRHARCCAVAVPTRGRPRPARFARLAGHRPAVDPGQRTARTSCRPPGTRSYSCVASGPRISSAATSIEANSPAGRPASGRAARGLSCSWIPDCAPLWTTSAGELCSRRPSTNTPQDSAADQRAGQSRAVRQA